jgi:hypothetical protein
MSKLLELAIDAVRALPSDVQDDIVHAMLMLAGNVAGPEPIDPAHLPAILEGLAQAKCREFATLTQLEAVFRRFDGVSTSNR